MVDNNVILIVILINLLINICQTGYNTSILHRLRHGFVGRKEKKEKPGSNYGGWPIHEDVGKHRGYQPKDNLDESDPPRGN